MIKSIGAALNTSSAKFEGGTFPGVGLAETGWGKYGLGKDKPLCNGKAAFDEQVQ
jgi:hypothetical protein